MSRWIFGGFVALGLILYAAWQIGMAPSDDPSAATAVQLPDRPPAPLLPAASPVSPKPVAAAVLASATVEPPQKLDPSSPEFHEKVDEIFPRKLYAEAATHCYKPDLPRDQKVRLSYKLKIEAGEVRVADATILLSTFKDPGIELCMRDAIRSAHWKDTEMPDYLDQDELLIRVRGMKKYLQTN